MERMFMVNAIISGVKFENVPLIVTEEGQIRYPLNSLAIAEEIAEGIAEHVKPYVTVDFSSVDRQTFLNRLNNDSSESNLQHDPEQQLLSLVFRESDEHE
ncbi:hypothetical protein C7445_1415 [Alicyclobacillus sacchari]|uniref:Uncharacterized protein n=1 Tax=Alicyclobacillus sacchari TaxID=392010 RepID=A0A4R8L592_9BACL|nr:hypothetical protein [Alicyclobacillus sacchari]TDY37802.1 hypothetical protein C7445_1415 [Alicyclobacillus sacchari]GMA59462.1 hypothetical protein GCM10025858_39660 [Alicyclobacillus sacchari]GMA59551.1 hypothetical protein GCM10025858_40550 [Alicyclobacillus sacchari]